MGDHRAGGGVVDVAGEYILDRSKLGLFETCNVSARRMWLLLVVRISGGSSLRFLGLGGLFGGRQ